MRVDSYLAAQVTSLCREHPTGHKVLVMPSRQAGYNLGNWIAREGSGWTNLAVETPLSLAERLAGPALEVQGFRRLSSDEALFMGHEATRWALSRLQSGTAMSLAMGPGLTRTVATTIDGLRLARIKPAELETSRQSSARRMFLAMAYRRYLELLDERGRYDAARVFGAASELVGESRYLSGALVAVADEVRLPSAAYRFVDACRRACGGFWRVGRPDFQVDPPSDATAVRFADTEFVVPAVDGIHPAGQVRVRRLQPDDRHAVRIRDAVGVDAEVRGVFREILTSETPLDQIEIVYTEARTYGARIATVSEHLEVPLDFGEGLPAYLTRPGRAALGYFRWLAEGLDARVLVHLLRSGLVSFRSRKVSAYRLAEVLQARRARSGRQEYMAALERERMAVANRRYLSDAEQEKRRLARIDAQEAALSSLLDLVDDGSTTLRRLAHSGRRFLTEFFRHGSERDAPALESIVDRLEDLMAVDARGDGPELAGMLVELMRDHRVGISAARESRLYAVPVSRAGYSGRRITFVLGLDEASFPGGAVEDPLLPDHERRGLSEELSERLARPGDRVWELLRFLGSIPGQATLVANRFDLVDGRERYASSVFAQCREDLGIKRPDKYAPSFESSRALTRSEVWITEREAEGYRPAVEAGFPSLAEGAEAQRQRSTSIITRYDGYLGGQTPELSLTDGKILSASRLERLASCPHRYFLQDVLHVRPLEDVEEDDHAWLDAREFGSLVHDVLCDFMRTMKERGERPAWDGHREDLHVLAEENAHRARSRIPPETEMAYQADVQRLKRTMDVFLAADASADYLQALEFEMRFGWDSESPRYPNPVVLDLDDGVVIWLRGSIDRVDLTREGFVVWDYKTGSSAPFDRTDLFEGEKLQWALYALAYRSMLEGLPTSHSVAKSGYFFVGERESGRRILQRVPDPSQIGRRLRPLTSLAGLGAFFHFQRLDKNSSPCRFCDFRSVCEQERRGADTLDAALQSTLPQNVLDALSEWMNL